MYFHIFLTGINGSKESSSASDDDDEVPFSCFIQKSRIYTHAPIANLLYHLGGHALIGKPSLMTLAPFAKPHWAALMKKETRKELKNVPILKIRVPGGKLASKDR